MSEGREPAWRVRRTSGVLVPGFTKRFGVDGTHGMTHFLGIPIGRFDVHVVGAGSTELRYRRWPVVDVLERPPVGLPAAERPGPIPAAGFLRLPGGRRARFCGFDLTR